MDAPPRIDSHDLELREPTGPIVEVRLRGEEVLLTAGGNALIAPLSVADRALVAAALSHAVAATLTALAADLVTPHV